MNPVILGVRIRQAREHIGMSQEDLAVAISKDQRAISEYENGKRKLSAVDLPLVAQVLNVPILYFYDGEIRVDDLDRLVLHQFQELPNIQAKQSAIQLLRIFSDALSQKP